MLIISVQSIGVSILPSVTLIPKFPVFALNTARIFLNMHGSDRIDLRQSYNSIWRTFGFVGTPAAVPLSVFARSNGAVKDRDVNDRRRCRVQCRDVSMIQRYDCIR